jgi:hypothetical protein
VTSERTKWTQQSQWATPIASPPPWAEPTLRGTRGDRCTRNSEVALTRLDPTARRVDRGRASPSVYDGIDNVRQLAAGVGERVKIMFAGPARLDQAAVPQKREVMAHRGLALRTQVRA